MKVVFLSKYHREGPSSRYRTYNYSEYFKNENISFKIIPLFYEGYVKDIYNSKKSIVKILLSYFKRLFFLFKTNKRKTFFVIEKELFPGVPYFVEKLFLQKNNYSIDYDDAVFVKYPRRLKDKHINLCKNARFVTCGNKWYFDQLPGANHIYLPTVINLKQYPKMKPIRNERVVICWIGTPGNIDYLESLLPTFIKLQNQGVNFKLRVIGCQVNNSFLEIENLKWSEEMEYSYLATSDIGIMPLFNSEWENGKCGFKLLQYMAAGLPVVGSPSAANSSIIKQGVNGFLASGADEWEKNLKKLCLSTKLRLDFGVAGRRMVESDYSYAKWGLFYSKLIKSKYD